LFENICVEDWERDIIKMEPQEIVTMEG